MPLDSESPLGQGASPPEVLYESLDRRIRIACHAAPPPGFAELLEGTLWGSGAVRYAMLDVGERVRELAGSRYLALTEEGTLAGAYVLAARRLRLGERVIPSLYRTLLAVRPGRARRGLGRLLVRESLRHVLATAEGPLVTYGFVEAENASSLAVARHVGHQRWGGFIAAPFTRRAPRDDSRVEPLPPAKAPAFAAALREAYRDHVAWDFDDALSWAPAHVICERGRMVAGAQALEHHWRLDALPGASGFLTRSVLPRLPGFRGWLDPDDLRFAFFGALFASPGHERDLVRLLEALLARAGLRAGMIYLDPRGRAHEAVRAGGGLGLVHRIGVRPRVHVMVSAAGLSPAEVDAMRRLPYCPSILDHV